MCDIEDKSYSTAKIDRCMEKIVGELIKIVSELIDKVDVIIEKVDVYTDNPKITIYYSKQL